jgi:hypothetical protein
VQSITRVVNVFTLAALLACGVVAQDPPPPAKEYSQNTWKEFSSKEGRFSVLLPGTPKQFDYITENPLGPIASRVFIVESDISACYVSYSDLPNSGPLKPKEQKEMLDSTRDRVLTDGAKLFSESDVSVSGTPGREFLAEKKGVILRGRMIYVNGRLYLLMLGVQPDTAFFNRQPSANPADRTDIFEQISTKFFDSFKLTK